MTAAPATLAGCPGPAANWHWLASAAEMAAETSGVWPITWNPSAPRWPGYPKVATRTPGAGAESVRVARDFTAATLARWEIGERGEDIVVVVSELVTNALRYTVPCPGSVWPRWPVRLGLLKPGPHHWDRRSRTAPTAPAAAGQAGPASAATPTPGRAPCSAARWSAVRRPRRRCPRRARRSPSAAAWRW